MFDVHPACKTILRRLLNRKKIGGNYTPQTRTLQWVKRLPPNQKKAFITSYQQLIKEEWLITKKKPNDTMISINPQKIPEILETIQ